MSQWSCSQRLLRSCTLGSGYRSGVVMLLRSYLDLVLFLKEELCGPVPVPVGGATWIFSCSRSLDLSLFLEELRGPVPVPGGATWTCSCSWRVSYMDQFLFLEELLGPVPIPGGATWTCSCYRRRSCADLFLQCCEVGLSQKESVVKVLVFIAYKLDKLSSVLKGPRAKYSCLHAGQAQ